MSTRFYAGPISSGMGRRWDDWHVPDATPEAPPRRTHTPHGPATPAVVAPPVQPGARSVRAVPTTPRLR